MCHVFTVDQLVILGAYWGFPQEENSHQGRSVSDEYSSKPVEYS